MKNKALYIIALLFAAAALCSCQNDPNDGADTPANGNNLEITTKAIPANVVDNMRAYTFHKGGASDKFFKRQLALTRGTLQVSSQVEVGDWYVSLLSAEPGVNIQTPAGNTSRESMPMYVYAPSVNAATKTSDKAAEIFTGFTEASITADNTTTVDNLTVARNVAKVEVVITKATPNFKTTGSSHMVKLDNVPSTISYTGTLLPSKTNPTLLSAPLQAPVTLKSSTVYAGYYDSDAVEFIIPAHKGADFTSASPTDITSRKMNLTVTLERATGGTNFEKTVEIPQVALCNKIVRINVEVNDGVAITTEILDWEEVDINVITGEGYTNWLYVKQGGMGTGQSWNDPIGTIDKAVTAASAIIASGKTVHGILVAGGSSYTYNENLNLPAGIKVYGGWEGKPGTELSESDSYAAYKSADRNPKIYKVRLSGSAALGAANTLLDSFILDGAAISSGNLVSVTNSSAAINAVQLTGITKALTNILYMTAGTAANVLLADNSKAMSISGAKLVNVTAANNATISTIQNSSVLNCAFWKSEASFSGTNTILNSAFEGTQATIPSGTGNVGLNGTNAAWFTTTNTVPGPHFNLGSSGSLQKYEALNDRCPLVGRGMQSYFDSNVAFMPAGYQTDIDGNPRHISNSTITTAMTDVGCYEAAEGFKGFILEWSSDRIYVTYKATYTSQQPLMIPSNDIYDIGVNWTATYTQTTAGTSMTNENYIATSTYSGSGTGVVVGNVYFKNAGNSTPTDDYKTAAERKLGTVTISTHLGGYLPDTAIDVYQTSGSSSNWTTGYVGSFHRNGERGARYISVSNTGAWNARIISGMDWIKIDANPKDYGENITDPQEGRTPSGGYYKEVEQVWKGVVSGTGNVKFRVGMQSKNTTGKPRYGLIVVTRGTTVSMFFVRQGEQPDLLYRLEDVKPSFPTETRTALVEFSAFNLTDPQGRVQAAGVDLGPKGAGFVQYPSQVGYYFRWNDTIGYLPGLTHTAVTTMHTSWSTAREVCPAGYRHGTYHEFIDVLYYDAKRVDSGVNVSPGGTSVYNQVWGAYADGYYDQLAADPISTATAANAAGMVLGTHPYQAAKGTLMVNHSNYASIFFPMGGTMSTTGAYSVTAYAMYFTTTQRDVNVGGNCTHWDTGGHIGMSCTRITKSFKVPSRCVKE